MEVDRSSKGYIIVCRPTTLGRDMELYDSGRTKIADVKKSGLYTFHIYDMTGEKIFSAKGGTKRGCRILDNKENEIAKLSQKLLGKKFELEYKGETFVPSAVATKTGFQVYSPSGKLAYSLRKETKGRDAFWYITVEKIMDWRVAIASSIFIGTMFWEELSRGRRALCWGCGEGCDPCLCCIGFIVILLIIAGGLGLLPWFFSWLEFFGI